VISKY
jgi:ribosomal protein L32